MTEHRRAQSDSRLTPALDRESIKPFGGTERGATPRDCVALRRYCERSTQYRTQAPAARDRSVYAQSSGGGRPRPSPFILCPLRHPRRHQTVWRGRPAPNWFRRSRPAPS